MKQKAEKVQKATAPKRRRPMSLERKTKWAGFIFLIPWILGTLYFFIVPFLTAVRYSFSNVILRGDGLHITFNGVENYKYIFFTDATYLPKMTSSLQDLVTSVPIIVVFSLFVAIILNQKFHGRTLARALFFLPVIVGSSMIISILNNDVFRSTMTSSGATSLFQTSAIQSFLTEKLDLPANMVNLLLRLPARSLTCHGSRDCRSCCPEFPASPFRKPITRCAPLKGQTLGTLSGRSRFRCCLLPF